MHVSDAEMAASMSWWRSPRGRLVARVETALDRLESLAERDRFGPFDGMAARALIRIGLDALANPKDSVRRDLVRDFDAFRQRYERDSDDVKLQEVARCVGVSAAVWRHRSDPRWATAAHETPGHLRRDLIATLGADYADRMPSVEELTKMLDAHSPHTARGRITTEGIVADVLLATGALDVSPEEERSRVLKFVNNALTRRKKKAPRGGPSIPPPGL
jgi:hypothetical protein